MPRRRRRREARLALTKYSMCLGKDTPLLVRAPLEWVGLFRAEEEVTQSGSVTTDRALCPSRRPFRKLDEKGSLHWDRITRLEKGKIYRQVRTEAGGRPCTVQGSLLTLQACTMGLEPMAPGQDC